MSAAETRKRSRLEKAKLSSSFQKVSGDIKKAKWRRKGGVHLVIIQVTFCELFFLLWWRVFFARAKCYYNKEILMSFKEKAKKHIKAIVGATERSVFIYISKSQMESFQYSAGINNWIECLSLPHTIDLVKKWRGWKVGESKTTGFSSSSFFLLSFNTTFLSLSLSSSFQD